MNEMEKQQTIGLVIKTLTIENQAGVLSGL